MNGLLGDIQWHSSLVYLDDIVEFGISFDVALGNLEKFLFRLRHTKLELKPKKYQLFRRKVEYLVHISVSRALNRSLLWLKRCYDGRSPSISQSSDPSLN
jgi:hypothetical protein